MLDLRGFDWWLCTTKQLNDIAVLPVEVRIEKVVLTHTVDATFCELKKHLSTFLLHTFVKREQAASFDSLNKTCDGKSIVFQVDFSENATIAAQKEVQAAHWHHGRAMIFTTHAWITNTTNFSMVLVSDDLNHTKYSQPFLAL